MWKKWLEKGIFTILFLVTLCVLAYGMYILYDKPFSDHTNNDIQPNCENIIADVAKGSILNHPISNYHTQTISFYKVLRDQHKELLSIIMACESTAGDTLLMKLMLSRGTLIEKLINKNEICPNHGACIDQTPEGKCPYCKREWRKYNEEKRKRELLKQIEDISSLIEYQIKIKK